MNTMFDLAVPGGNLGFGRVRTTIDGFGQDFIGALGSLYTRVLRSRTAAHPSSKTTPQGHLGTIITSFSSTSVPHLPPLEQSVSTLKRTLEILRNDGSVEAFTVS